MKAIGGLLAALLAAAGVDSAPRIVVPFEVLVRAEARAVAFQENQRISVSQEGGLRVVHVLAKEHQEGASRIPLQVLRFKIDKGFDYPLAQLHHWRKHDALVPALVPARQRLGLWGDGRIELLDDGGHHIEWLVATPPPPQPKVEASKSDFLNGLMEAVRTGLQNLGSQPRQQPYK
ncbi:MAG: hypothetical protein HY549_11805 [Elusimicrobia bacterium]|nr:hypothetical protein [Elusimicrobiota bacterium]